MKPLFKTTNNMPTLGWLVTARLLLSLTACVNTDKDQNMASTDVGVSLEMEAELTAPPHVPKPAGKRKANKLIVKMEILEKEGELTDGVKYVYWTFGGTVPGSFIRTRVGDEVEFHL